MSVVLLMLGLALLMLGAEGLVRGGVGLALRLHVQAAIIGLTLVAWGTSAPELVISLTAAKAASTDMALGNVVGSSIANIALVLALAALIRPVASDPGVSRHDWFALLATQVALILMALDGRIGRIDGALLILGGVAYNLDLVRRARRDRRLATAVPAAAPASRGWLLNVLLLLGGVALLTLGSYLFVAGASAIARALGTSDRIIGLTIVAVGTSAPELATSVVAAIRGQSGISVGNVVGSNLFNTLFALGFTALFFPLVLPQDQIAGVAVDLTVVLVLTLALAPALVWGRTVTRSAGGALLAAWIAYILFLIL